jgi:hypothetical protein
MENIIYVAAPRDWFDYLATLAPLVFSAIAVIIAICTANRQNRIALFEERFNSYQSIFFFLHAWNASLMFSDAKSDSTDNLIAIKNLYVSFLVKSLTSTNAEPSVKSIDIDLEYSYYTQMLLNLNKLSKLFLLPAADQEYLKRIETGYVAISALESLRNQDLLQSITLVKPKIKEFFELLKSYESFLKLLEEQVNVSKL